MTLTERIHDNRLCEECGKPLLIDSYWGLPVLHEHPEPRWLKRLQAKDMTAGVLYNGSWTPEGDGGAA